MCSQPSSTTPAASCNARSGVTMDATLREDTLYEIANANAAKVAAKDFQTSGGNAKDDEIESLNKKLRRFYNKFGTKDDSGQPVHSPSQVRKLAHKFAGKKERLNEGLAEKYKKTLADLSDTDSDDSDTGDIALL